MLNKVMAVAVLVAACTGSPNYWVPYNPARGTMNASKAAGAQAAVVAITDAGREVDTSDAATGIVLSKWFNPDGFMSDQNRFRVRVTFADNGAYEVVALCQSKDPSVTNHGNWIDCTKDTRPRFVVETVAKVEANLKNAKPSEPPAAAAAAPQPQPRGFYCASGSCARDKAACDQARIAASDASACSLVESAHCFALTAGGESCGSNAEACTQRRSVAGELASGDCGERK